MFESSLVAAVVACPVPPLLCRANAILHGRRRKLPSMEPLPPSAKPDLMNGAPYHGHACHRRCSLAIAAYQRETSSLIPHRAGCSISSTPHTNDRLSSAAARTWHAENVVGRRRRQEICALESPRLKPAILCLLKHNITPNSSNWCSDVPSVAVTCKHRNRSHANFFVEVWRNDQDAQASAFSEKSSSANEELLLFFFQLDLTTRLQRALNMDQYQVAQQLREKIVEVDKEVERLTDAKYGSLPSKAEAQDRAITILRLKTNLQQAVEAEDYHGAAALRDQILRLEAETLAASAKGLGFQNVEYSFRLGQKVQHTKFGYRGVICGMDPFCSESDSWLASGHVQDLPRGKNQPFYQVLVDMRAEPDLLVAYVAEDNLITPKELDKDSFDHPYVSFLFYGMDSGGDLIPIKQLREKYSQPRHELPWEENKKDTDSNDDNAKP